MAEIQFLDDVGAMLFGCLHADIQMSLLQNCLSPVEQEPSDGL